jgi:hypothetical protein
VVFFVISGFVIPFFLDFGEYRGRIFLIENADA